ncbi:metallophosphoesterase family protein [Bradyrhizobium sp. sBnM-33]|uniref:metallophosphoesterase family protein n=1 Tax=Bradyrhizobium sp. sBnM-33 TaxID=2831780 RepID=UPI0028A27203|nr:metallophosphoesterase family protein [Bradyrhizobium sp. sBnM-33]WOH53652.1 metallophosphoesterase family protein [Bradyrhizobium sp. sBnM-33]
MLALVPGLSELRVRGRRPSVPAELRIYAIGDIHGRLDLLNKLLARISNDIALRPTPRPLYVFLGDYIDRGPSSRETIDRLVEHRNTHQSVFLKGNHELIAIKCLSDPVLFDQWLRLGGLETLISYGVPAETPVNGSQIAKLQSDFHSALPPAHFRFFRDLRNSFECGDFFFAHAGVKPNVALSRQKENDLLWIRREFLSSKHEFGKIIVHGHTPTREIEVGPNRINIDTGAFATGRLSCLVLEGEDLSVIDTSLDY